MKRLIIFSFLFSLCLNAFSQRNELDLIQVSGIVMSSDSLYGLPYATIAIEGTSRGTYANFKGFFSLVARKGETIIFSSLGYKDKHYIVPDTIVGNSMAIVQLLSQDAVNLPETVIFPWPSKEHFRLEFLAMDVSNELKARAERNLSPEAMAALRNNMVMDGRENGKYYLQQQAQKYYYAGQTPPMQIFNAFAWAKFIEAWKRGDYKKKKDK